MIPTAIQDMAKAAQNVGKIDKALGLNEAVAAMLKLQEQGQLISSEVLPEFGRVLSQSASKGLVGALDSNRVSMNRLMFSFQEAADIIFKSGFGEGLTELFNSLSKVVVDLKPLWESLGMIIGSVFSLISDGVKAVTPTLISLSNVFNSIVSSIGDGREYLLLLIGPAAMLGKIMRGMALSVSPWVAGLTAGLLVFKELAFWAEEIDNLLFSKNKIGVLYDPRKGDANNTSGNVAKHMLGAADTSSMGIGDSIMASMMGMFSQRNMGSFVSSAMGSSINAGSFLGKQFTMTGNVIIDGQKVGEVAAKSDAVRDTIQSEIRAVNN